jgi:hypothetical protein
MLMSTYEYLLISDPLGHLSRHCRYGEIDGHAADVFELSLRVVRHLASLRSVTVRITIAKMLNAR